MVLALARGYSLAADEWLGRHETVLGLGGIVAAYKNDAVKNLAYASAAKAGARGLYAAKKLSELVPGDEKSLKVDEVEVEVCDAAPATREALQALGVGKLKQVARANKVDVSGCVEKGHLVDALLDAHVPLPADPNKAPAAPPASDAARKQQQEEAMKASMPIFLEALLRVSLVDVHETVRNVCAKVLADEALDLDGRKKRALGLKLFGAALFEAKKINDRQARERARATAAAAADDARAGDAARKHKKRGHEAGAPDADSDETTRRFEHAVNVTMAAAMGQELSEDHGKHKPGDDAP